jgi:amino acid adenylation domain-containing protein
MSRDHRGCLTPGERALWFLQRLAPASGAYNLAGAVRIADLDTAALRRALLRLVERHPALRTTYPSDGGDPLRQVHARLDPEITEERLDDPGGDPDARRRRLESEAVRPFDPAVGPLMRVWIFSGRDVQQVVLFVFHHLIADFWSLAVVLRELGALYGEETGGPAADLAPEGAAPYAEWAESLERALAWERGERLRAFWLERLGRPVPVLALPANRPRPPVPSGGGHARSARLGPETTARLLALGRRRGATLFETLLAGFQLLLHRLSGDDEVWIGVPTAGRSAARWAGTVGYFVNPVVMRSRLTGEPDFSGLVDRAREESREALAHRDWPFPLLAGQLQPSRDGSWPPLFRTMMVVHRTRHPEEEVLALLALGEGGGSARFGGLTLETLPLRRRTAQLDLALAAAVIGGGLHLTLEVDADLFDGTTAARLVGHLGALLTAAVEQPEMPAGALPLLSAAERHALLVEWNDTEAGPGMDEEASLLGLFAAQAARTPEAVAVVCGEESLKYGELSRRADRLADWLRRLGVGPEARVGVLMDRSPAMVVGLLGILGAGGAYVPVDPAHPAERRGWILGDADLTALLTERGLADSVPAGVPVLWMDAEPQVTLPETAVVPRSGPDHLAYVIYTSGSTGRPKGVEVSHRGLMNLLRSMSARPGLGPGDSLLAVTTLSFDIAGLEIFLPLIHGARVVLADRETAADGEALSALIERSEATVMQATPVTWQLLLRSSGQGRGLAGLKALCGGEALAPALASTLAGRVRELWNLYGPTETTIWSTVEAVSGLPVTIGRPIDNTHVLVLGRSGEPVPVGAAGELCIGGLGLARGYLKRPDLTAERFVPDLLGREPGARLYRTGDLARWRPDGCLELLGRLDQQVKLRGFRIEPGEVEAALAAHPAVREAAVLVRRGDEDRRLVAYVAGVPGLDPHSLREHLAARLPAPLVPTLFVVLDHLPLTPSGKIDRRTLASLPLPEVAAGVDFVPPRDTLEEALAAVWSEVLGRARIGAADDFFALGGHSLLATRLLARVRDALGIDLPLRVLFAAPTVAGLATAVEAARREGITPPPPVTPAGGDERHLLSFAQERLWFLAQWIPDSPAYGIPAAVRLAGTLDVPALAAALREIVRRHEILRTTFSAIAGLPVQLVHRDTAREPAAALPVVDLSGLAAAAREQEAAALSRQVARRPFDLERGPLLRTTLVRLGEGAHLLLVGLHHIAADGASLGILLGELRALYPALAPLPPLPVQYADFAAWQRRRAEEEGMARALAWWRGALAGAPAGLDLPADRPRPAGSIHRGGLLPVRLGADLTAALRALARRGRATLFMALLAGLQALLARLSGADDLVVGTAIDQRTPEVEGLIGLFVNLLPLRGDLSGDPPVRDLLARARRATLEAHDHSDVPFERLVAAVEPSREPGRHPLFQVALSFQNEPFTPDLSGLSLDVQELETGASRFDLTLLVREADGGLTGHLEYSSDLFDAATVQRLLAGLEILWAGAAADPGLPLSSLPLLTADERRQILADWGRSADQTPREGALYGLFAGQAERFPDAVAVVGERAEITYREAMRRATALARRLRALGVGPDVPVALCLERSPEMVIAMLGTVQAGGAYLPLDLTYPRERLAWMLADSGAAVAVARGPGLAALAGQGLQTVDLDRLDPADAAPLPPPAVHPDNLAYLLYTSGSTGRPKGVAVTHRGVARLVIDPGYVDLGPGETILQLAPVAFDGSTFEIWGALLNGGRLAIAPPAPLSLHGVGAALRRFGVTTLFLTTGLFHQMVDQMVDGTLPEGLAGLRQLVAGGDAISMPRVRSVLHALPGVRLVNGYGPTEATTFALCHTATAADLSRPRLPVGRPIPRTSAHIGDGRSLEPVPPGVPGELWLGGDGLARGYYGRPDLTAERFVPHPFAETPGERLYRTGDLARWTPEGEVDLLGRIDRQLKIRGFRVEPAEVEAVLEEHPGVAACVVQARGEGEDKRLAAWVVPAGGAEPAGPSDSELLAWCRERLPAFLMPGAFVRIQSLPLDPNGKVDRRALPEPDRSRRAGTYVAPRTPVEEKVAAVWAEVLGLDRVGTEDDFFALGGHSLLATQIVARLSRDFGLELGLYAFFAEPTVSGVAVAITREQIRQGDPERMTRLLARVQSLSPEELADFLRENRD